MFTLKIMYNYTDVVIGCILLNAFGNGLNCMCVFFRNLGLLYNETAKIITANK